VEHVFIVGLPRTGSTLTQAILNASPQVGIGGESKFLPTSTARRRSSRGAYRDRFRRAGDIRTDEGIARVAAVLYAQSERNYWSRLAEGMDRTDFETRLRSSDRSERALFGIAMDHFANGRPIRGDKSPQHIHWIPLLLEWFPDARIVHTFRDPRAIYMSLRRKPARARTGRLRWLTDRLPLLELYSATSLIFRWRRVIALHREYQARYPDRYMLLRFEDLIAEPRPSVKHLCSHVGVEFVEGMLDQVVLNSSFMPRRASKGFDPAVIDRWRLHMSPMTRRWFAALCGRELQAFGYVP
jgi:hypothetical protein